MSIGGLRSIPVHPVLFAVFPVLFLFAQNVEETPTADVAAPLALAALGAGTALGAAFALLKDARRAAIVVSPLVLAFFSFGHVRRTLEESRFQPQVGRGIALLGLWVVLALSIAWLASRLRRNLVELTAILNVAAAALALVSLIPAATYVAATRAPADAAAHELRPGAPVDNAPDIYYLIFDRYGSQATLQRVFGIDNSPFLGWLESTGFQVIDDSRANYPKTAHSLAASLNMTYLDELAERHGPVHPDWLPIYGMLQDHAVGRFLQAQGYEYIHIGSWWDPTSVNNIADDNPRFDGRSDFSSTLYDATLAGAIRELFADEPDEPSRRRHYDIVDFQQRALARAGQAPGPTFVFAHVLLPHEPYVFDAQGRYVTAAQERAQSREAAFADQLAYTNTLIQELISDLLDVEEGSEPVIILQADEGPHPLAYERGDQEAWNWEEASIDDLEEKFQILNALYLPGEDDPELGQDLSPVNSFRLVLSHYFGADLPLLPDRQHVFRDNSHPLLFTEITDRLAAGS
ncbi:MAG TPA: sulfatase-like hydrolase/transferase [Egibacteraceae bacterium]|nr:sulfatase-like hydrolase/transferase [Egibacteraceae bacterium]